MNRITKQTRNFGADLLSELHEQRSVAKSGRTTPTSEAGQINGGAKASGMSFLDHVKEGVNEVNTLQKKADVMATDLASGKSQNLHETMLSATHAELSFNLMVALRNKALEAYQEVMRMQV